MRECVCEREMRERKSESGGRESERESVREKERGRNGRVKEVERE